MALRDGKPYMSWGTPGGDQQDQWSCQFFLRHASKSTPAPKMNLQEAIDAPAWHIEHFPLSFWPRTARPGVLVVEGRLPKATIKELERRGHKVVRTRTNSGGYQAILIDPKTNVLRGGSEFRKDGAAVGY